MSDAISRKTVAQSASAMAAREPDRITHVFDNQRCRIADLVAEAERLAAALHQRGLRSGDVVAFQLPNWRETLIVDLACARLGLVVMPVIPIYRDAELAFMLADSGAKAIFVPEQYRGCDYFAMVTRLRVSLPRLQLVSTVRSAAAGSDSYDALIEAALAPAPTIDVNPDAVKVILYTSGTTGRPKAVLHSHVTLPHTVRMAFKYWGQDRPGDRVLMASPVTHLTGFAAGIELPMVCGVDAAIMERWEAKAGIDMIEREQATIMTGATPFLEELLTAAAAQGKRLPSLRVYICGGAAVPPQLIRKAHEVLANCRACRIFGSSEAPIVTFGFMGADEADLAADTDGKVVDYEVRIKDDEGRELPPGATGEICVRGAGMFLGYADAAQTAECVDADGFFAMGDIGHLTRDNALVISGRKKDLINRGGEKISAKEIEDILHHHAGIVEAAVVSMPHERLGETICAYVIARAGHALTLQDVCAHVAASGVAKQKLPERLVIVDSLPRNPSGKIRKDLLRQDIRERIEREKEGHQQ